MTTSGNGKRNPTMTAIAKAASRTAPLRLCFWLLLTAAQLGCSPSTDRLEEGGSRQRKLPITFSQGGGLAVLPLIAKEQGFFDTAGIAATIVNKGDGKSSLDSLLSKDCVFATCGETPLAALGFSRDDFVVLASISSSESATKLLARRDAGIKNGGDLKGKHIGARRGTLSHYYLDLLLKQYDIAPRDVTVHFMESKELPQALARGEIAAYSGSDEFLLNGMKALGDRSVILEEPGLCFSSINLVARKQFVAENKDAVKKVLAALIQAEGYLADNPTKAWESVQRLKAATRPALEALVRDQNYSVTLSQSLLLTLEDNARWMTDNRLAPPGASYPNYLNVIDTVPLRELKPYAVTVNR